jgi:hypothetical protein
MPAPSSCPISVSTALNKYLRGVTNKKGQHMRPQRDNSAEQIQTNFTRAQRLKALADFYKMNRGGFPTAAKDFFAQHPSLQ